MPGALSLFWKEEIESVYKFGELHTFIVYLNVADLARDEVYGYMSMKPYIMEQLNAMGIEVTADAHPGGAKGQIHIRDANWIAKDQLEELRFNGEVKQRKKFNDDVEGAKSRGFGDKAHEGGNMPAHLNKFMYDNRELDLKLGLVINPLESHGYLHGNIVEWATNLDLRHRGYIVVAMANNLRGIPGDMLNSDYIKIVRIPYPDYTDRLEFTKHLISSGVEVGVEPEHFARITGGLELKTILQFAKWTVGYGEGKREEGQESQLFLDLVEKRKQKLVGSRSRQMLEVLETADCTFEKIGGLENVKSHLRGVTDAIAKGDRSQIPAGLLFIGPRGTGKVIMAKALANEANMTCVQLKKLKDFCSDANASEVLALLQMFTPVVVFIDDIDNPEGVQWGNSADSKTPIPPELLDFMSAVSLRGQVLWIGASNRPDKIDPVFSRSGRFPDKLLFLMPDKNDREDIIKKFFANDEIPFDSNLDFSLVADDKYTHDCTSAELYTIVKRSYQIAQINSRDTVSQDDLLKAADNFIPSTTPEMSEYFTLLAISEVNSREFIPPNLPPQIKNTVFEGEQINRSKIDKRLEELAKKLKIK